MERKELRGTVLQVLRYNLKRKYDRKRTIQVMIVGNLHVRCAVGYRKRAKDGAKTPLSGTSVTLVEQRAPVLL